MSIFKERIQINAPSKSKFDFSHERKLSCEMGRLVPIFVQETLPGDSFRVNTNLMVRLAPMLAPLYHKLDVYTHYFFVPNRIIWNEWETFITGGADGMQAPVHPAMLWSPGNGAAGNNSSLPDYMGLPTATALGTGPGTYVNLLPFRAYAEIYNEYYRDENLVAKIPYSKGSGQITGGDPDFLELTQLRYRAWEKDYFTTALPFAQKGGAAAAPAEGYSAYWEQSAAPGTPAAAGGVTMAAGGIMQDVSPANISLKTEASVLITELRKAARLQEFLEAAARGGHRLTEWILHVFGVESDDRRIQRPAYLGGGKTPITVSEVLSNFQFSGDAEGKPQGNMTGHGIAVGDAHGFEHYFDEHGFIIGIMSIVPRANYFQGLEKFWQRPSRFDYYIPQFAHLGEQEVKNGEVFFDANDLTGINDLTFGYQSRYADYKFKLSTVHGEFRDSLYYWHMARKFSATPGLNENFITCIPTTDIFAVPSEPVCFVQIWNDCSAVRPLPYFSNPKL